MHGNGTVGATHTFSEEIRRAGANDSEAAKHPSAGSNRMDFADASGNIDAGEPENRRNGLGKAVRK